MITIPSEGKYSQPNSGTRKGNIFASFNIDLSTDPGTLQTSGNVLKRLNTTDNTDFAGYAGSIIQFLGDYYAVSDKAFKSSTATGTYDEETVGAEPDSGNTIMDSTVFDGLLLVSEATDIKSKSSAGGSWSSWWQTTLGAAALTTGTRHLLHTATDGNLYVTDLGNKLYKVTNTGTESTSGDGTLDFSATPYQFQCINSTSTRMWIGTKNTSGGEAVIIEWDMSATSNTANKLHKVGSTEVGCIAVWNDTPIAVLRNGKIKYHNGTTFVDWPNAQFPVAIGDEVLLDDFVHYNGWAIIDNLPHFLVKGGLVTSGDTYADNSASLWNMPSGIYCLDPEVGLYHRFAIGSGASTQDDYGHLAVKDVGALYAVNGDTATKFLASYDIYTTGTGTSTTILASNDVARTKPARSWYATTFLTDLKAVWKDCKTFFKKLETGEQVDIYYRYKDQAAINVAGAWASTTQLNTTASIGATAVGDVLIVKNGDGAGVLTTITAVNASSGTTELHLTDAVLGVTVGESCTVNILNFRRLHTITNSNIDWDEAAFPDTKKSLKVQLLFHFRQAASSVMQQEYVIIE